MIIWLIPAVGPQNPTVFIQNQQGERKKKVEGKNYDGRKAASFARAAGRLTDIAKLLIDVELAAPTNGFPLCPTQLPLPL